MQANFIYSHSLLPYISVSPHKSPWGSAEGVVCTQVKEDEAKVPNVKEKLCCVLSKGCELFKKLKKSY